MNSVHVQRGKDEPDEVQSGRILNVYLSALYVIRKTILLQ